MIGLTLSPQERTRCRIVAGLNNYDRWTPVEIVDGAHGPEETGESYHWTTLSGKTVVHHPSAYGWPTWYHPSTRSIQVGEQWILSQRSVNAHWPKTVVQTLREYAESLKNERRRPVDTLALKLCGFAYGTWRRDPVLRANVLAAIRSYRARRIAA